MSSSDWKTVGHAAVKAFLEGAEKRRQFFHAYAFIGPRGVGKSTLAQEFAERILGGSHIGNPDYGYFDADAESGVEDLRNFLRRTSYAPIRGNQTVFLLDNADSLNAESANALLKTLEEPSIHAVFILVCQSAQLPATVFSRCTCLYFHRLPPSVIGEFSNQQHIELPEDQLVFASGSLGKLIQIVDNKKYREVIIPAAQKIVTSATSDTRYEKMVAMDELSGLELDELREVLSAALSLVLRDLPTHTALQTLAQKLLDSLGFLQQNINKKLILQGLLL